MENKVIKGRLQKLRAVMKEKKIDYYMMPTADFHNSEYVNDYFKVRSISAISPAPTEHCWYGRRERDSGQMADILSRQKGNWKEQELLFSVCWMQGFLRLWNFYSRI